MPLEPQKPFVFKTQLNLVELTGFKASNIAELRECLEKIPESSVYYHTHNFLQQHQSLVQEPPNDFAHWVTHSLNEGRIGETLASIDTVRFHSLEELRAALIGAIDPFLKEGSVLRKVPPEQEFRFMKSILFVLQTPYTADTLAEFLDGLKKVSIYSLYYHLFEARLRSRRPTNDFSLWLDSCGETKIAREIGRLDPYSQTMEDIRRRIILLIEKRLTQESYATAG